MSKLLHKFLGSERWSSLLQALKRQTSGEATPDLGIFAAVAAIVVASAPVLVTFLDSLRPKGVPPSTLPTVAFGICALLALLLRARMGLGYNRTKNWRESLSLTHTAVALGCIPAVLILVISKGLLADRHDLLATSVGAPSGAGAPLSIFEKASLVIMIAAWVAVTEELIFRGLLVSVLRRCSLFPKQIQRDTFAAITSALLFGLAHWPTWGPLPAIAITGLGLGFVAGYIANGEQLGPLVLYHFIFDALSIGVSAGW